MDLPEPQPLNDMYAVAAGFLPYDAEFVNQPTANLQHFRSKQFEDVMPDELLADTAPTPATSLCDSTCAKAA